MPAAKKASQTVKKSMSDAHKAALAAGREEGRAVRAYLEALDARQPRKRGRKRTPDSIRRRLSAIAATLPEASPIERLHLTQERSDLQAELQAMEAGGDTDLGQLRDVFIKVAKSYGERRGVSYSTWREVGVDAGTLREAGIGRGA